MLQIKVTERTEVCDCTLSQQYLSNIQYLRSFADSTHFV